MRYFKIIRAIAYADFLERIRRYSFLIVIALTILIAISFIPTDESDMGAMSFGNYRGLYNSAWIGLNLAIPVSFEMCLFGFYLVNNSISRDKETGISHIIAATGISNRGYILGKFISNIMVLSLIIISVIVVGIIMQFVRGEDYQLQLWLMISPFIVISGPAIIFTAALAVFFETLSGLNKTVENILYFFLFMFLMTASLPNTEYWFLDILGGSQVFPQVIAAVQLIYPDYTGGMTIIGDHQVNGIFFWSGLDLSTGLLLQRLLIIVYGVIIYLAATQFFNRFGYNTHNTHNTLNTLSDVQVTNSEGREGIGYADNILVRGNDSKFELEKIPTVNLRQGRVKSNLLALTTLELMLAFNGRSLWWYLLMIISYLYSVGSTLQGSVSLALPILLLIPVGVWSQLGNREVKSQTAVLFSSHKNYIPWQFLASYFASVIIIIFSLSGIIIRFLIVGDWLKAGLLLLTSLFIPALAAMLGAWSRTSRLFEIIYVCWWYIGPFQKTEYLDFTGMASGDRPTKFLVYYLSFTILFLLLAYTGKKRKGSQ